MHLCPKHLSGMFGQGTWHVNIQCSPQNNVSVDEGCKITGKSESQAKQKHGSVFTHRWTKSEADVFIHYPLHLYPLPDGLPLRILPLLHHPRTGCHLSLYCGFCESFPTSILSILCSKATNDLWARYSYKQPSQALLVKEKRSSLRVFKVL